MAMKRVGLSIGRLRWISIIAPTLFVVAFELVAEGFLGDEVVPTWGHALVALVAVSTAASLFSFFVFSTVAKLEREVRERSHRLGLLNALAKEVSESLHMSQVAEATVRNVVEALEADAAGLALARDEEPPGNLQLIGQHGLTASPELGTVPVVLGEFDCETRKAVALGMPVVVADTMENSRCSGLLKQKMSQACVAVPVKSKGRNIGAIFVAREATRPFEDTEVELLGAVGSQIGSFLENAQLFANAEALAVLQERERVAREVHDGLAQTLGYLNVQLGIIDHLLKRGEAEKVQTEIEQMTEVTREAYGDLRQAIVDLRVPVSAAGLRRTLREYAEEFSRRTGIVCHFEGHHGFPIVLAPSVEVQLVRIVQEALTNAKKHAPGCEVWLSVEASQEEARVTVRDNGPGFDPNAVLAQGMQFGLRTMIERAESAGGKLRIESAPGAGTTISAVVPTRRGSAGER